MINIIDKKKCCGCSACVQVCPRHCIQMQEDVEGFLYPKVNVSDCINCGLCEKICPELNLSIERNPIKVIAAKNKNEEVRSKSSSGGVFTLLAERVIDDGGVVFGARFNEKWEVIHDYVEEKSKLNLFRGSKYVQSVIGNSYILAKKFLESGRKVLFSGTSCQIKGLLCYLRKDYSNLITVDVICHGVPSPKVWRLFLSQKLKNKTIVSINFRDKISGWKNFSSLAKCSIDDEDNVCMSLKEFMTLFFANMILRPSCHMCSFKGGRCGSDVTLGDFWGIEKINPKFDDDGGVSVVLFYNEKVYECLGQNIEIRNATNDDVVVLNQSIIKSVQPHPNRNFFFYRLSKNQNVLESFQQLYSKHLLMKIYRTLFRKLKL